jgi:hypothetical protein
MYNQHSHLKQRAFGNGYGRSAVVEQTDQPRRVMLTPHRRHLTFSTLVPAPNPNGFSIRRKSWNPNQQRRRPTKGGSFGILQLLEKNAYILRPFNWCEAYMQQTSVDMEQHFHPL